MTLRLCLWLHQVVVVPVTMVLHAWTRTLNNHFVLFAISLFRELRVVHPPDCIRERLFAHAELSLRAKLSGFRLFFLLLGFRLQNPMSEQF